MPSSSNKSAKENNNISRREKLQLMDTELKSFYEYCQQAGFTDEEMETICRPLTTVVRRITFMRWLRIFVGIFIGIFIIYTLSKMNIVTWHGTAIGRIFMIKLLPFFDWTSLFYKKCLVEKNILSDFPSSLTLSDCAVCEAVESVQRISETDYNIVLDHHLIRGAPVIVTDTFEKWRIKKHEVNITKILEGSERLRDSVPCVLQTNIRAGKQPSDLNTVFSKINNIDMPNWFLHFQNCDIYAAKSLRVLAPRPYFLSHHISPSHFNWLLMSNKYSAPRFKHLDLDTGLIMLFQLKGSTILQLSPRSPCEEICSTLTFDLRQSETLVLANSMWHFEYMPDETSENLALLTETVWEEA